ncbi:tetratricopeptide repeat protein, partial [Streptomyces sp. NPDC006208]|uniref:tetratricopeptide repeat protein n=1 Tax=Streptomyces sp. NPDC006208 TaxID=3156734 RepID=UPI0033A5194D
GEAGDAAGAARAFAELLDDELRVLGPDHPATLGTRHNSIWWRGQAGDAAGAAAAFEQVLEDLLRVLGPDHPATLTTRADLAWWRGQAGDPREAAAAYEQVVADRLRVLGPDHPGTLDARAALSLWQAMAGEVDACLVQLELVDDQELSLDAPIRICLRLHAEPGHPWALPNAQRPTLEVVATPVSHADIEPASALYEHTHDLEFSFVPRRPGRHIVRFTIYHHATGAALQQVETELIVVGPRLSEQVLMPLPEHSGRR